MVDDLDEHLHARGYLTDRLHGDITQAQRDRVMQKFRERKFEFLVATDVAARGLDIDDLEVVFNFDLPNDAEDYTHRIGRTGRAGRKGQAFTFVSGQEIYKLQSMVRWARLDIRRGKIPSLDEVEEARTNVFFEKIRATLEAKKFKPHDRMIDRLLDQGFPSTDICSALIHMLQGSGAGEVAGAKKKPEVERLDPKPLPVKRPANPEPTTLRQATPPAWAKAIVAANADAGETPALPDEDESAPSKKSKYERPARTGREPDMVTIFINVGRKQLITPADIVGKIAGVTRLPATIVGAIDIHQRHTLADVAKEHVDVVLAKLTGIRVKGIELAPTLAQAETA